MKSFLYCSTFFLMLRLLHIKDAACREKSLLSALFSVWLICKIIEGQTKVYYISAIMQMKFSLLHIGIFDIVSYLGQNSQTTLSQRHIWHFLRFSRKWFNLSLFSSCQWRSMPFKDHCLLSLSRFYFVS